jgi:hypothetical protein
MKKVRASRDTNRQERVTDVVPRSKEQVTPWAFFILRVDGEGVGAAAAGAVEAGRDEEVLEGDGLEARELGGPGPQHALEEGVDEADPVAFDVDDVVFGAAPEPDLHMDAGGLLDELQALEGEGAVGVAQDLVGQLVDAGGLGVEAGLGRGGRLLHVYGVRCCRSAFKRREMRHGDAKGGLGGGRRDA